MPCNIEPSKCLGGRTSDSLTTRPVRIARREYYHDVYLSRFSHPRTRLRQHSPSIVQSGTPSPSTVIEFMDIACCSDVFISQPLSRPANLKLFAAVVGRRQEVAGSISELFSSMTHAGSHRTSLSTGHASSLDQVVA